MYKNTEEKWIKIYEEHGLIQAELLESRFDDEGISYRTFNKINMGYAAENGSNWTNQTGGKPITIYVRPEDEEKAKAVIEEDRSDLLYNPDLDFGKTED